MKRSNRLVVLTNFLLENPRTSKNLSYFAEEFQSAKSSISEDLDIVNDVFKQQGIGYIERSSGSAGGARFIPKLDYDYGMNFIRELCEHLGLLRCFFREIFYFLMTCLVIQKLLVKSVM